MKPVLRKLLVTAGVTAAVLLGLELALRRQVPHCGVTPFRKSELVGLSAEFRPGFTTLYKGHQVSINSDGFRGPELPAPEPGVLRVALVGDSFTFGTAIGLEDTLAVSLERALEAAGTRAQVLNLGVPGYCALEVAELVEHRALALQPDLVLYVFFANDIDAPMRWETIPPDAVIDAMQEYPLHSALAEWLLSKARRAALALGLDLGRNTPEHNVAQYEQGGGERLRDALGRMQAACSRAGVRLAMGVYPYPTRVDRNPYRPVDERALRDARRQGVECLDLLEAFEGERDLTRYQASAFDSHPDGEANRRVAAYLAARL